MIGGDLEVGSLLTAYRNGIFPWSENPVSWWCPDPRAIFEADGLHISRSLRRTLRRGHFRFTIDHCFGEVIRACARREGEESWITSGFVEAYRELHRLGHAHSIETWSGGELCGGLYGVALGGLFAGESMFHHRSDASKAALAVLHRTLFASGYVLFDIQMLTPVTREMGAVEVPRTEYLRRLAGARRLSRRFPVDPLADPVIDPPVRACGAGR